MNKSSDWLADPCHETVDPDITERYAIGKTDFERWGRLWKARASDPELDAEEVGDFPGAHSGTPS
jgi:hypothetical protein